MKCVALPSLHFPVFFFLLPCKKTCRSQSSLHVACLPGHGQTIPLFRLPMQSDWDPPFFQYDGRLTHAKKRPWTPFACEQWLRSASPPPSKMQRIQGARRGTASQRAAKAKTARRASCPAVPSVGGAARQRQNAAMQEKRSNVEAVPGCHPCRLRDPIRSTGRCCLQPSRPLSAAFFSLTSMQPCGAPSDVGGFPSDRSPRKCCTVLYHPYHCTVQSMHHGWQKEWGQGGRESACWLHDCVDGPFLPVRGGCGPWKTSPIVHGEPDTVLVFCASTRCDAMRCDPARQVGSSQPASRAATAPTVEVPHGGNDKKTYLVVECSH